MKKILLAAILSVGTTTMAFAAPIEMTATQLDQVTAGFTVGNTAFVTGTPAEVGAFLSNWVLVSAVTVVPNPF